VCFGDPDPLLRVDEDDSGATLRLSFALLSLDGESGGSDRWLGEGGSGETTTCSGNPGTLIGSTEGDGDDGGTEASSESEGGEER